MPLFARKPSRALEAEFVKQANFVLNIFGHALQLKTTNPAEGKEDETLDLTVKENRDAIRDELVRIIREYRLEGCREAEIGGARLIPLMMESIEVHLNRRRCGLVRSRSTPLTLLPGPTMRTARRRVSRPCSRRSSIG